MLYRLEQLLVSHSVQMQINLEALQVDVKKQWDEMNRCEQSVIYNSEFEKQYFELQVHNFVSMINE